MLRAILFNDKRFETRDDNNLLSPLTNNTIIICADWKSMDSLATEILNTINGKAEYNDYDCDDEDIGQGKLCLIFGLQRVIDINGQKITLALEPAITYKAESIDDIWFFDWLGDDKHGTYREFIYPMTIFKGSRDAWNAGKDKVYRMICNGRYGAYNGEWVDLKGKHYDQEVHNCLVR